MKTWKDYEITKIKKGNKRYPKALNDLIDPPKELFVRGVLSDEILAKVVAIVGSRAMSRYGKDISSLYASECAARKVTTISGFMYGVDTNVHTETLLNKGTTIAVFGCGLNVCYPPENAELYTKILNSGGAVISEYEPNLKPKLWTYIKRNRIVAALAKKGVIVVEAGEKSGSLITAQIARKINRDVYAVPGSIYSKTSKGTNLLIQRGEALITLSPSDIFENEIKVVSENLNAKETPDKETQKILEIIGAEEASVDEISQLSQIDIITLGAKLSLLTLGGILVEFNGKYSVKK